MTAAALAIASGEVDAFALTISAAGDAYLKAGEYDTAVGTYQAAGQSAVTKVGPDIDASIDPALVGSQYAAAEKASTQAAWAANAGLQSIKSPGASAADAQQAQGIAKQMLSNYRSAIKFAKLALSGGAAPGGGGTPGPSFNWTALIFGGVAAVSLLGLAYCMATHPETRALRRQLGFEADGDSGSDRKPPDYYQGYQHGRKDRGAGLAPLDQEAFIMHSSWYARGYRDGWNDARKGEERG